MVEFSLRQVIRWTLSAVMAVAFIVVMLLWLAGTFNAKIDRREVVAARTTELGARRVATVNSTTMPYAEWAIGSTQAVHETTLGARLLAFGLGWRQAVNTAVGTGGQP